MKNGKNVKRILAGITAVVLAALPVMSQGGINDEIFSLQEVSAAEENTDLTYSSAFVPSFNTYSMDNDEAFAGYVQNVFYGDSGTSLMTEARVERVPLDAEEKRILGEMKDFARSVADGLQSSTSKDVFFDSTEKLSQIMSSEKSFNDFINRIMYSLMSQCPYELYWFDKTVGVFPEPIVQGNQYGLRFYFVPSEFYKEKDAVVEYEEDTSVKISSLVEVCSVNTEKTGAAMVSASKAKEVASYAEAQGYDTYQKLKYFKDYICEETDYNNAVNPNTAFGDPWQLIYVFDGDKDTNVVCEGYAKAFKYLCDLSEIDCILATGGMAIDQKEPGPHMWNIVTLNKDNYLVDVTNCDSDSRKPGIGAIGHNFENGEDFLFMSAPDITDENGCVYASVNGSSIIYIYDAGTYMVYPDSNLIISDKAFHEDAKSDGLAVVNEVSATLGGKIGLNFYMNLLDNIAEDDGAMIYIYRNGLQVTKEFVKNCKQSDGRYKVTYNVNAKEMHDTISIQLVDGNNKVINLYNSEGQVINSNFEEISGSAASYSVAEYFSYIKKYSENQKMTDLADAALVYGSEAQKRFDYDTASATDENDTVLAAVTADTLSQYAIGMTGSCPSGLAFESMSLLLKDETTVRLYFTSENIDNYSFEVEGYTGNPLVKAIGKNYVEISNIPAKDLDKVFNVKIKEKNTAADDECVISVSALSYAFASVTKNTASSSVVKALYLYNKAADNYFSREEN